MAYEGGDTADFGAVVQSLEQDDTEDIGLMLGPMYDSSVDLGTHGRRSTASPSELLAMLGDVNGSPAGSPPPGINSLNTTAETDTARQHHTKTPAKSCIKQPAGSRRTGGKSRVVFGSPKAAQFHTDSPAVSYTPMSKRAAAASFSMRAAATGAEEAAAAGAGDADTSSNTAILQAWDTEGEADTLPPPSGTRRRSSGTFRPAPAPLDGGASDSGDEGLGPPSDSGGDSDSDGGMDTRESLSPTAAAALLLRATRVGGSKRRSMGGVQPPSTSKRPRRRRSSVGGLQPTSPSLTASRRRSSIASAASPRDIATLVASATSMLAEGEDEITFAGTPTHKLSASQLRNASAAVSVLRSGNSRASGRSASSRGRRRGSVGSGLGLGQGGDDGVTEDLGDLGALLAAAVGGGGDSSPAHPDSSLAGGDSDSDGGMDTRESLSPTAAAAALAAATAAVEEEAASAAAGDVSITAAPDTSLVVEAEGDVDESPAPSSSSSAGSVDDAAYAAAMAEEEGMLLAAGVTPTRRASGVTSARPTSADRISVAASARAASRGDQLVADATSPDAVQPTALSFASDGEGTPSPPHAPAAVQVVADSPESPVAPVLARVESPAPAPAPLPSSPTPAWAAGLQAPGLVSAGAFLETLDLGPSEGGPTGLAWDAVAASPADRAALVAHGLPGVVQAVKAALGGGEVDEAAVTGTSTPHPAAAHAVAARVLMPHNRALAWAVGELGKQVAVAEDEVAVAMTEVSARNPPALRRYKAAVVGGGGGRDAARAALRGAFLSQAAAAALRFQGWKVKLAQAVTAAFDKGLRTCGEARGQVDVAHDTLSTATRQLVAAAEEASTSAAAAGALAATAAEISRHYAAVATARAAAAASRSAAAAAAPGLEALRAQVAAARGRVAVADAEADAASDAAAALEGITAEEALAGTVGARAALEAGVVLGGWALVGGASAATAASPTPLLRREVGTVTPAGVAVALGCVEVVGGSVTFTPAPATGPGLTRSQREVGALGSYLVHDALVACVSHLPAATPTPALLAALGGALAAGCSAAGDVLGVAAAHPVEVARGAPLPRSLAPGQGVGGAGDGARVTVTLTHRSQRGKVALAIALVPGGSGCEVTPTWRIGGKPSAVAAVASACAAARPGHLGHLVATVDGVDFSA